MSLLFSLLMKMDAGQAKAELRALQGELDKGKASATALAGAAQKTDQAITGTGRASAQAAGGVDALARSQIKAAQAAAAMEKQNLVASASMGNLVANFNDIGVMIAAGQNPLQLAIQQGTQITQVIGPMGAAGAFKQLGGAVLAMFSPMNMATLLVIGFGAAAVQWLTGSTEAAKSLSETVGDVEVAVASLNKVGAKDLSALQKSFGDVTPEVLALDAALRRMESVKAFRTQADSLAALKNETEGSWFAAFTSDRFTQGGQIADILGTDWLVRGKLVATEAVNEFRDTLNSLDAAKGPREQLAVFTSLRQQMELATGGISQMDAKQLEFYSGLVNSEAALRQMVNGFNDAIRAQEELARGNGTDNGRMGGPMAWDYERPAANQSDDLPEARELLAILQEEAGIRQAINEYGRESATVALLRLEAEQAAFAEMAAGLDVGAALKAELIEAWGAANGLASARIAAMIEQALGPASRLSALLKSAAGWWGSLKSNMAIASFNQKSEAGSKTYSGRGGDPRDFMPGGAKDYSGQFVYDGPSLDVHNNPIGKGGAGGGGGGGAKAEKDAVAELIQKLREEQEVLRETDPVKKEMLKYRKQLAEATKAERAKVEELIRAEIQLRAVQQAREYASDAVGDFLEQIIEKGAKASDVLRNLAAQFLSMAARSFISGQGWFAQALGIAGPVFGGGRAAAAAAPAAYAPPAARGVMSARSGRSAMSVERSAASGPMPAPQITQHFHGVAGNSEVARIAEEAVRFGLKTYDAQVLPARVAHINRNPRERG